MNQLTTNVSYDLIDLSGNSLHSKGVSLANITNPTWRWNMDEHGWTMKFDVTFQSDDINQRYKMVTRLIEFSWWT